ncbi:MAG: AAA family ATPase [Chitinispirillales bacterium]|jgi:energy-coupling factor transporter ATP-binding protein EcfA2|nr:AAA family ATPase [Chitinispirillales bacterium]
MITSVGFKNFRGLNDLTLPLSQVTMLTGVNGAGKTSVLEGLYCLFSETRLDVSQLSRYNKSIAFAVNQSVNVPLGFAVRQAYNYKLFWDECPSYDYAECSVNAKSDDKFSWVWKYKRAKLNELDKKLTVNNPIPVDSSSEFALWNWSVNGIIFDKKSHQAITINEVFSRAQILAPDDGLYLLPLEAKAASVCKYLDFASIRLQPQTLSFQTSKQLTNALKIINPHITDIRLTDIKNGLSVVLDDSKSVTLGAIGNGAVTWVSALIAIFEVIDAMMKVRSQSNMPVIVLIDEMGAGIHYSVMRDVWKHISEFVKQNSNIQFVFTSHSNDCVRAYCEAFQDLNANVVRLYKTAIDGKITHTEYIKDSFENIINGNWEVRG